MPTPAKPSQPYTFPRALATSPYSFVPQIKPDVTPEGNFVIFLAAWALPSPQTTGPSGWEIHPTALLTPVLEREHSTNLIPNFWAQPSPALPQEEVMGMGGSCQGLSLRNTMSGS